MGISPSRINYSGPEFVCPQQYQSFQSVQSIKTYNEAQDIVRLLADAIHAQVQHEQNREVNMRHSHSGHHRCRYERERCRRERGRDEREQFSNVVEREVELRTLKKEVEEHARRLYDHEQDRRKDRQKYNDRCTDFMRERERAIDRQMERLRWEQMSSEARRTSYALRDFDMRDPEANLRARYGPRLPFPMAATPDWGMQGIPGMATLPAMGGMAGPRAYRNGMEMFDDELGRRGTRRRKKQPFVRVRPDIPQMKTNTRFETAQQFATPFGAQAAGQPANQQQTGPEDGVSYERFRPGGLPTRRRFGRAAPPFPTSPADDAANGLGGRHGRGKPSGGTRGFASDFFANTDGQGVGDDKFFGTNAGRKPHMRHQDFKHFMTGGADSHDGSDKVGAGGAAAGNDINTFPTAPGRGNQQVVGDIEELDDDDDDDDEGGFSVGNGPRNEGG